MPGTGSVPASAVTRDEASTTLASLIIPRSPCTARHGGRQGRAAWRRRPRFARPFPRPARSPSRFTSTPSTCAPTASSTSRMLADPAFQSDPALRRRTLPHSREHIARAPDHLESVHRVAVQISAVSRNARPVSLSTNSAILPRVQRRGARHQSLRRSEPDQTPIAAPYLSRLGQRLELSCFEERSYYRLVQPDVAMVFPSRVHRR